jgi:hypothetical protein
MLKMVLVVAALAVPAFGAGVWTASIVAPNRAVEANGTTSPSTISPYEKQPKVKPDDLPVEYMPLLAAGYGFRL